MEGGKGGGSAEGSWDLKASLGPAPYPLRGRAILFFFFFVQRYLVFLFKVAINTRNNKMARLGNRVPI